MRKSKLTKMTALLLAGAMAFGLSACGGSSSTETTAAEAAKPAETTAAAAGNGGASAPASGEKVITAAISTAWDTMMPLNTTSNYTRMICDQIYDRLTQSKADGTIEGRLAESWSVNEDSTAVTFKLHDNAVWSDGEPVTAADVVFSYQMYSDPKVEAKSRYHLQYIAGVDNSGAELSEDSIEVKADDDYTVTFTLKESMFADTFLQDIDTVFIIPKHIFEGKTAEEINAPDLWAKPVGSGPFIYDSEINGERMEFVKNPNYYLGAPKIDRLILRVTDAASMLAGLINGELDMIGYGSILTDDWEMAQEQENLVTEAVPTTSYTTLIFNTDKPYLNQEVRQALSMAINRQVLVDALLLGEGEAIVTPFCSASPYYNKDVEVWYDPEKAKTMLQEAKFPFDQTLTYYISSGSSVTERTAALIAQDLQKVGVKVQIEQVDFPTLMNNMLDGKHDLGMIGSGGTMDPSESREMIHPDSSVNFCQLKDTELTDIIDKGNAELSFEARKPYFDEYQVKIRERSPMAYLYTKSSLTAYNKRVSGINAADFNSLNWSSWNWDVQ
ncbi:MAG: peptide ABC transporter substrate-binding protein [Lachnospiraceae bacterium]|nr:peptide ABC transporter substrate-binding protein [Lachnospiraceae bacterium]